MMLFCRSSITTPSVRAWAAAQQRDDLVALLDLGTQVLLVAVQPAEDVVPGAFAFQAGVDHRVARPPVEARKMPEVDQLLQDQANTEDGPAMPGAGKMPTGMAMAAAMAARITARTMRAVKRGQAPRKR
jgi:hypothetical protein